MNDNGDEKHESNPNVLLPMRTNCQRYRLLNLRCLWQEPRSCNPPRPINLRTQRSLSVGFGRTKSRRQRRKNRRVHKRSSFRHFNERELRPRKHNQIPKQNLKAARIVKGKSESSRGQNRPPICRKPSSGKNKG